MEVKLRQRIIGGVVLVTLAIIFLPLLFKNSDESKPVTLSAQIPPAPAKPVPASQTIVMIKNKDLTTPETGAVNPAADNSINTNQAAADNKSVTAINQNNLNRAPVSAADNTEKNINSIEDATLSPPGSSKNSNTGAGKTNKSTLAKAAPANKPITTKKHLKAETSKPEAISKTGSSNKKHHALAQQTKTTESINKTSASAHKNNTTTKPSASLLTNAQNSQLPAGSAWEVRLGSFANSSNVKDLVAKLRAHGFKAYTQSVQQSSLGALTRVAIGPEVKRDRADAIQARLAKELNIKSEVVPFSPAAAQ